MRRVTLLAILLGLLAPAAYSRPIPKIDGYVTSVRSPRNFAVDGIYVACGPKTEFKEWKGLGEQKDSAFVDLDWNSKPYLGEHLRVFGRRNRKTRVVAADRVLVIPPPTQLQVRGSGIITRVLPRPAAESLPGTILVRADGYPVLVNAKTLSTFKQPLKSIADIGTNVWISFEGKQGRDGVVIADKASFVKNEISHGEGKLRHKWDYDPEKVNPEKRQSDLSKAFLGVKLKRIPPYHDPAMQARIDRIGASLVPAYQRALSDSDPTKIHFRFQLVDSKKLRCAMPTPNGIVLVSHQTVSRMQNDSQLAAVLASGIAAILEKDKYRVLPDIHKMQAADLIPIVNIATIPANLALASKINESYMEQDVRVTLGLVVNAGYDIDQAPIAFWILSSKKPKPLADINIPNDARYMYWLIGTTWRAQSPAAGAD